MTLKQIAALGRKLTVFLALFADCFGRKEPRELLRLYVRGQFSDLKHKNAEAIALKFGEAPRTLQRFLESIKWDEEKLVDYTQKLVATQHAHSAAIGIIDESGVPKSGEHTAGVDRQWCGNLGKVDNCVVGVHLVYAAPGFQCLLGSRVYLPEEWANDAERRKQNYIPEEVQFRTKPQIALEQIDRALGNGIAVAAWTCDEFYGRSSEFLDGLEQRKQIFVAEVPVSFHGWVAQAARPSPRAEIRPWPEKKVSSPCPEDSPQRGSQSGSLLSGLSRPIMATISDQRYNQGASGMGSQMVDLLAQEWRRVADSTAVPRRRPQHAHWGREVLRFQPRSRRTRSHTTMDAPGSLRAVASGAVLPAGEDGTRNGPLPSPGMALPSPPFLPHTTELPVLRPGAIGV